MSLPSPSPLRAGLARLLIALAPALAVPAAVQAQVASPADATKTAVTQYRIDGWQTEQGLPLNTVQSMLQTRDGHLWVGTGGGLARFDGIRFTTFESSPVTELASGPVFGFMEDAEGRLWIGHRRGAARFHRGRFEPVFGPEQTAGRRVWAFAQGRDGAVWAATENGLLRWHDGATKVYREADGLPTLRLRTLAFDRDGTLWIGTSGGGLVAMRSGGFEVLNPASGFPHLEVRHVLADPEGGIWAATAGAGLVRVNGGRQQVFTITDGLPTNQLTALARDRAGNLWIGTWGAGVVRMNPPRPPEPGAPASEGRGPLGATPGIEPRFSTLSSATGLAGDQIWSLHADREGSLWVGTWHGGLSRLSHRAFVVFGKPEGLSADNVRSVLHARDGAAWVAMAGGGVNRVDALGITRFGAKEGLPTDEASGLYEDHDGAIWVATYTAGVAWLSQGRIETYGPAQGLPSIDVRVLHRDRRGTLWAGTRAGLARFDGRAFLPVRDAGAPSEGVGAILEARDGTLWFGTAGQGLYRYRDGAFTGLTRKDGLASNWILALHEDAAGTLWIGTNGEGLNRLRDGRVTTIGVADGLWDGMAQVIIEDRHGDLWMTCNRGFYRVARAELDAFAEGRLKRVDATGYGPGDALRSTTFAGGVQPAGAIDADGQLWLPSFKGLVIVDPARLPGSGEPPPVFVEEVAVGGKTVPPEAAVVLPPGAVPLSIRYAAATLNDADRVRFRYRLEGLATDWVEAAKRREASFEALPHGHYRFRVAATVDGKRWQEAPSALEITVQPHFTQTPWFLALAGACLLGGAAAAMQWRTHQLRRRHAEMERLVAAKTEELRLANEHLSRLSFADALTGLPNRRRLDEVLDTEWRRAARAQTPLALVIADIDAFKAYNDTLGHPAGDACLVTVAEVIRHTAHRAGDFAARYGGEEFVVLIAGADHAAAMAFAELLRRACEARAIPHPASPQGPVVTLSLGVAACVPQAGDSPAALVAGADAALYRAKQAGRNRVR